MYLWSRINNHCIGVSTSNERKPIPYLSRQTHTIWVLKISSDTPQELQTENQMNLLLNDINQDMATEMILQDQLPLYYLSVFKCPKLVAQKSEIHAWLSWKDMDKSEGSN